MNLNQITLPVTDIKKSVEFYITMGFTQIVDSSHYARFYCEDGGSSFSLALEKEEFKNGATIYFEMKELDLWVAMLIKRGLVFEQLPKDESYLWREAILKDPSNNKIKLYWAGKNRLNPPWRVENKIGDKQ